MSFEWAIPDWGRACLSLSLSRGQVLNPISYPGAIRRFTAHCSRLTAYCYYSLACCLPPSPLACLDYLFPMAIQSIHSIVAVCAPPRLMVAPEVMTVGTFWTYPVLDVVITGNTLGIALKFGVNVSDTV